jgi:lipopolysaccharide/colanic/teichoic acid biosynthesis glycosyltransferase
MGFRGQSFTMFKLRTMTNGCGGAAFTEADDPRVTHVGRVLRRYRIDELPQIFNVLLGQMSWIGPRPESIELAEWYEGEVPFYSYRHIVRPGITGWAQTLQGNVAEVSAATEKLRFDFYYIKYFSPWLDVLIAARTIRAVLTGFGSR